MCIGGGSSGQNYYANQDKLLGAQADIATGVYNSVYQPYAPKAVEQIAGMVDDAQSGQLTGRARATAGADAGVALGTGLDAATRSTERFGATINPNAVAHDAQAAGIQGAALKSGAMNNAQQWGEQQKWGRTTDFYNSLQGVPTQSASTLGSAAQSFGQAGAASTANQNTAAGGLAKLGVAMGTPQPQQPRGYADGGEVKGGLHLAAGGVVPYLPKVSAGTMRPSHGAGELSALDATMNFAAPMAASMYAPALKDAVKPYIEQGIASTKGAFGYGAPVSDAVVTPVAGEAAAAAEGATALAGEATGAEAAAAAAAAAEAAAAEQAALLLLLKDGGSVPRQGLRRRIIEHGNIPRKDLRPGGHVSGPGTSTSDSVPAQLSAGEFVLNASAVKLIGKGRLEALNQRGLAARQGAHHGA